MPWPALILGVLVLAVLVWLLRELRESKRMMRQIEDWQRRLEEIERQD